ncbi:MAG: aspartate--tRNA ligase [Desulfobacteraceae bacterium]
MQWKERDYCGALGPDDLGRDVLLMGWVDAIRDHGHLLFIHLRDITGIVQVVFHPDAGEDLFRVAETLRSEYVIGIRGKVTARDEGTENPHLKTGTVEVAATEVTLHAVSLPLPFPISEKAIVFGEEVASNPERVDEDLRLRYRYLDLRRPSMQHFLLQRNEILKCIRRYMDELRFIEVETPFLTKSTPEGARDYLVPSRVHPGRFYALPQSPQLFKQILMMSGMDRYYQIARCFRDEDLRPNRQPEFTQLDLEAAFIDESFIYEVVEELIVRMFAIGGISLERPFPRMPHAEAMARYGTDRPDLRFGMRFEEATDLLRDTQYGIFRSVIAADGVIKGFRVEGGADALSKNVLQNEYAQKIVPAFGGKGMTWMKHLQGELQSNIAQFFSPEELAALRDRFTLQDGDVLLMVADSSRELANEVLGPLRLHVAERLGRIPDHVYRPVWITDFPLFELKEDELSSQHHPFTMPDRSDFDPSDRKNLLSLRSRAYDLVMNGEELGGGSIRIHRMDIQERVFQALGMGPDEVESKFGFFLRALEYGAPPHGGLALGLDRVAAMILGTPSIRDVIAFPKNRSALCPLTRAPSTADPAQLEELHIAPGSPTEPRPPEKEDAFARGGTHTDVRISRVEVAHVARLARLRLTDDEIGRFREDLGSVLEYVTALDELDTDGVSPMSHVREARNIWREDVEEIPEDPAALLKGAPEREDDYFKVPKILEG